MSNFMLNSGMYLLQHNIGIKYHTKSFFLSNQAHLIF